MSPTMKHPAGKIVNHVINISLKISPDLDQILKARQAETRKSKSQIIRDLLHTLENEAA